MVTKPSVRSRAAAELSSIPDSMLSDFSRLRCTNTTAQALPEVQRGRSVLGMYGKHRKNTSYDCCYCESVSPEKQKEQGALPQSKADIDKGKRRGRSIVALNREEWLRGLELFRNARIQEYSAFYKRTLGYFW